MDLVERAWDEGGGGGEGMGRIRAPMVSPFLDPSKVSFVVPMM